MWPGSVRRNEFSLQSSLSKHLSYFGTVCKKITSENHYAQCLFFTQGSLLPICEVFIECILYMLPLGWLRKTFIAILVPIIKPPVSCQPALGSEINKQAKNRAPPAGKTPNSTKSLSGWPLNLNAFKKIWFSTSVCSLEYCFGLFVRHCSSAKL